MLPLKLFGVSNEFPTVPTPNAKGGPVATSDSPLLNCQVSSFATNAWRFEGCGGSGNVTVLGGTYDAGLSGWFFFVRYTCPVAFWYVSGAGVPVVVPVSTLK